MVVLETRSGLHCSKVVFLDASFALGGRHRPARAVLWLVVFRWRKGAAAGRRSVSLERAGLENRGHRKQQVEALE